ncbi:Transcription repressor OFP13 [Ananas comosus]|uniref:Transcription repressor n=1 Tax=Ananas comosus TaxID=4615 RepID=A0A199VFN6_ANACO|nr:Transcription repressor OFP13 [Ananas comosus]
MARELSSTTVLLHKNSNSTAPPPLPWPSCKHPETRSSRANRVNSARFDSAESCFSSSSSGESEKSLSTISEASVGQNGAADDAVEAVIRGLRPDPNRLFFEPGSGSSSIAKKPADPVEPEPDRFEGGVAVAVDSEDLYADFRASMEAMVAAHGVKGWDWLEEMLTWYLRANGKETHGVIVGAFLDLLVAISASSTDASSSSSSSSSSFSFEMENENENSGSLRGDVAKNKKRDE